MMFPPGMLQFMQLQFTIEAEVTHPPGTILDQYGNPTLDENGKPLRMDQLRQEDRR
jgi:hypothetical protein